jgi:Xaa-Pro aminopeptidase
MKSHFTSKFFAQNRRRLQEHCDGELIVITANGLLQRGADSTYRFSQDANFWYLTGIDEPDIVLVLDGNDEYLILPDKSDYQRIFDGSESKNYLVHSSGIKRIYGQKEGWEKLGAKLKHNQQVATVMVPPAYSETYGLYTNPARAVLAKKMKSYHRGLKIKDVAEELANQRMIKQPEELAAIQQAIDITTATLQDVLKSIYKYEYELEAAITAGFRRRGAAGHAFEPIVAAGERACVLHNVSNNGIIGASELVVVDVGAEVENYAADITRTVYFGRPSARQRSVHQAVLETQKHAISLLKPGLSFKDYRDQTDNFIGEKMRELGLIKTINKRNIHKYYPHSISHFLGLNVHDVGDYTRPLEPGMVLTVEPGIYIPEEGIGVRIEDDVLITRNGCKTLSAKLPRGLG